MVGIEQKITQRLITEGFVDDAGIQECFEIQKFCNNLGMNLSLHEIIIHKFPKHFFSRQNYLEILIHILETPEISQIIDPCTLELGYNCENIFTSHKAEDTELHKSLLANGVVFPKSYTNVLKNSTLRPITDLKIRRNNLEKWSINISTLLQTVKNKQLMPLNSTLQKLCGKTIPFETIEKAQELQKKVAGQLSLPLIHVLVKKYRIEPYLLHAILISQARIENGKLELWLGGNFISSHNIDAPKSKLFLDAQKILSEFLETSFAMTSLGFRLEKEVIVVENIQKYASSTNWNKAIEMRKQLAQKKFPFSLLKIVWCKNVVSEGKIFFEILKNIYKVPEKQAQTFVSTVYSEEVEEAVDEAPPLMNISLSENSSSDKSYLDKTMSLNNLSERRQKRIHKTASRSGQLPEGLDKTMSRTGPLKGSAKTNSDMQSLDKTISRSGPLKGSAKTNNDMPSLDKTISRSSAAEKIRQRVLKAQQKKEDLTVLAIEGHLEEDSVQTIQAKISKYSLMVRAALKKEYLTEEMVIRAAILQGDNSSPHYGAKIIDILHQENNLDQEQYDELINGVNEDAEAKLPILSKNMDLKISNELITHNMVTREQVQKVLRVQRSLQHMFIAKSVDSLLTRMKIAPADIVEPVVAKIKQSLRKTVSNQEMLLSNEPIKSSEKKGTTYSIGLLAGVILLFGVSFYNFSQFYYGVEIERSTSKITQKNNTTTKQNSNDTSTSTNQNIVENNANNTNKPRHVEKKENVGGIALRPEQLNKMKDPNKDKRSSTVITLKKNRIEFLRRNSSYGVIVSMLFDMEKPPGAYKLNIKVQLYDAFKNKSYKQEYGQTSDGKCNIIIGPLDKALCEGLYYIKASIVPSEQTNGIRRFYQITTTQEWWISYLHSKSNPPKNDILRSIDSEEQRIQKLAKQIYKQNQSLEKMLNRKPQEIRQIYEKWREKWQKRQDAINKELQAKYFIPVFPKTEQHLMTLGEYVNKQSTTLHKWVTSFDLFPPQINRYEWQIMWNEFQQYLKQDQELLKNIMSKL